MFETVSMEYYLILAAILFVIGTVGVLTRRNAIIIFMSIELMLNSVNLTLVSFSSFLGDVSGQIFVFFVMAALNFLKFLYLQFFYVFSSYFLSDN